MTTEEAFQAAVSKGMWDGLGMPPRVVLLPWPDKVLSQNARVHWSVRARATKLARTAACYLTREVFGPTKPKWSGARLSVTFNPPSRRRFDRDGLIGRLKASQDGISDALGVDDSLFSTTYATGNPVKGGSVRVEIWGVS